MGEDFWRRQLEEPAYPDILWARPENKQQSGTVVILTGSADHLAISSSAFQATIEAGVKDAILVLPDKLKRQLPAQDSMFFVASTPSGSLAESAFTKIRELTATANSILLPGGVGHNSETQSLILEVLDQTRELPWILSGDAFDVIVHDLSTQLSHDNLTLVLTLEQLQRLNRELKRTQAIVSSISLHDLVLQLHDLTQSISAAIAVEHDNQLVVAYGGNVSNTPVSTKTALIRLSCQGAAMLGERLGGKFEVLTAAAWAIRG